MGGTFSSDETEPTAPLRVAQWATGNIGSRSLRHIIEHPAMELVGVFVYGADKVGLDAGDLCELAPTGVITTDRLDTIIASRPDCVLYMPRAADVDVVCALLAAGINVVSTCGMFHHPPSMPDDIRQRVEGACATGGASIHSTGSSPGFISEALPLVLLSIQRRLDRLTIDEFADLSPRNSPELLFEVMGFGTPPADLHPARLEHGRDSFGPSLQTVADMVGLSLDRLDAGGEVAVTPRTVTIAAGTLEAGTVAAQRVTVAGIKDGREVIRFRATWYCCRDLEPAWDLGDTGWRVSVEGDAPLELDVRMPITLEQMAAITPGYTANRAVNAVSVVCAAPPGIRTVADLPAIVPVLG
ncbi:MAG: dihydrodipicolinate reductase [Ilumatobacteraceae bacterium]|nr:dihydrodipicolinate reductase [Ilumatobacteraceae bacterium]